VLPPYEVFTKGAHACSLTAYNQEYKVSLPELHLLLASENRLRIRNRMRNAHPDKYGPVTSIECCSNPRMRSCVLHSLASSFKNRTGLLYILYGETDREAGA